MCTNRVICPMGVMLENVETFYRVSQPKKIVQDALQKTCEVLETSQVKTMIIER